MPKPARSDSSSLLSLSVARRSFGHHKIPMMVIFLLALRCETMLSVMHSIQALLHAVKGHRATSRLQLKSGHDNVRL